MFAAECGLGGKAPASKFFMVEETGVGRDHRFSDEKLALVLAVYRVASFDDAIDKVRAIMEFKGKGHSVGIHTGELAHARRLAEELDTARVLVNMAHTFGNGGGFDSGLNFTLSMAAGRGRATASARTSTTATSSTSPTSRCRSRRTGPPRKRCSVPTGRSSACRGDACVAPTVNPACAHSATVAASISTLSMAATPGGTTASARTSTTATPHHPPRGADPRGSARLTGRYSFRSNPVFHAGYGGNSAVQGRFGKLGRMAP